MLNVSANSEDSNQSVNLRGLATGFVLYLKIPLESYILSANRKDSDQPALMRRLVRAFAVCKCQNQPFCISWRT